MGYIYTAVVRDKEGKIITYGDYAEYQSPPENITKLASLPGNTISTTSRKEGKGQYFNYASELGTRQNELRATNERLLAERESAIKQANVKARQLAQTTGNPFVSQGAREITRRKAVPVFQNLSNIQNQLEANSIILDNVIPGTTIQKTASSKARADDAHTGIYDEKGNEMTASQVRAAKDAQSYNDRNLQSTQADFIAGDKAYDIAEAPRNMTREQAQEYNKSLIKAQQDLLKPAGTSKIAEPSQQTYIQSDTGFPIVTNPNVIPQPITKYKVTEPNGKERIFNTKESADKFVKNYGGMQTIQGPVQPSGISGSLDYLFGERPKEQGPNISDTAFFVGANAQGYIVETTRDIKKPDGFLEGLARPFTNILSASKDFGLAVKSGELTSPAPFTDPSNPFGLPVPKTQTPVKPTATSQVFEGKVPDVSDPAILGSAVTEGALLVLGIKAPKIISGVKGNVQGKINEAKVTKILSGLESPKLLQSGKVQKVGPNFPNAGEFKKSTYEKTKFGNSEYLEEGQLTVKAVKGRPDLVKIDSSNPLQDKSIYAVVEKGKVIGIKTIEPETGLTTPQGVRIRTNPNDVFGAEVAKFDLIKTEKGIYETTKKIDAKSPILEAAKSSAVQPVARARSFAIEDVIKNPKEFSRYFFQETTVSKTPTRPISDTLLSETKSYQSIGTKIQTKTPSEIPTRGKSNIITKTPTPEIFKPFAESTVSIPKSRFDIFGKVKFKKKKVTDSYVSDLLTNIKEIDPFTDLTKFTGKTKKTTSYSKRKFSIDEPFTENRPQQLEKPYSKQNVEAQIKEESVTQDILFGKKRNLTGAGVVSGELITYPENTPEKIKELSSLKADLESRTKQSLVGSGDYFKRYGLDVVQIEDSKTDNLFKQIPISIHPTKQKEKLTPILTSITITGLDHTPIQTVGLKQTPIQGQKLVPIITPITEQITETPTRPFVPGFRLGGFGTAFPGFGGGYDDRKKRKKGKKKYIVSSIDPMTPGSIETAGVKQQQVSSSKKIYKSIDVQLGKARRKNRPRGKKSDFSL